MTLGRRVASELARLIARWFVVLLIAFALLSCLHPALRVEGSQRARDREAEIRALERWSFHLPALINIDPQDALSHCNASWKRVASAMEHAASAGLSERDTLALLEGPTSVRLPTGTPDEQAKMGKAIDDLRRAQSDYRLLVRHGSLSRFALESAWGKSTEASPAMQTLRGSLRVAWATRGSSLVDIAPPDISVRASARAILSALAAGREPPKDATTFAPWALDDVVSALSELPDATFHQGVDWVVAHTALPDPRLNVGSSRAAIEAELASLWRRRRFALTPSSAGSRALALVTETRFATWCSDIMRGDFGSSLSVDPSTSAMALVATRIPTTLLTCGFALALAAALGVVIGLRRSRSHVTSSVWATCFACLPEAWIGTLVLLALSYLAPDSSSSLIARWAGAVMTLAIPAAAVFARHTEAVARVARRAPWIEAARARGTPESSITTRHVWPHTRPTVLSLVVLSLPALVTGSVVAESLFRLDGVGSLLAQAAVQGDFPVGLAVVSVSAAVLLIARAILGTVEPATRGVSA